MIFRNKKLNAFMTGSLVALVAFGYPSRLLAQSNSMDGPIQGITSTTQEAPTTAAQVNDVMTGLAAGVGIGDLLEPKPDPIREHTAFLTDMWDVLLDSDYSAGNSYLTTGEWLTGTPSGTLTATNEVGNTVTVDVTLSLEILPEQFDSIEQESLDILSSISARIGMAWTTMSNPDGVNSNILIWWYQWNSQDGVQTAIGPLTTINQEDMDLFSAVVPLMDDFFDNPLNYNIDEHIFAQWSIWSTFRNAVIIAVIVAVGVAAGPIVVAALAASSPVIGASAAATAANAAIGTAVTAAVLATAAVTDAYLELIDDLANDGWSAPVIDVPGNISLAYVLH